MKSFAESYPIVLQQDVLWGDMDAFQHVNNTVYFRYFEDARLECLHRIGANKHMDEHQVGPILASTHCNFRAPLAFPDRIQIAAGIRDLQAKRFTMTYAVFSENLGKVVAEGEGLIVYYDYKNTKTCEIPDNLAAALQTMQAASTAE